MFFSIFFAFFLSYIYYGYVTTLHYYQSVG